MVHKVSNLKLNRLTTTQKNDNIVWLNAGMAELADAPDLGSGGTPRAGSSPVIRIKKT